MSSDKIILRKQKRRANDNTYRVRVSGLVYDNLEALSEQTNLSMTEIVSVLLDDALKRVEVEE